MNGRIHPCWILLALTASPLWAHAVNFGSVVLPDATTVEVAQATLTGPVQSVDVVLGRLAVQDGDGAVASFIIDDTTPIRDRQGLQIGLADLKPGQSVSVLYQQSPIFVKQITQN